MSLKIGTNFDYQGRQFLDARQSIPRTKTDLLYWDILVPEGFEVFVEDSWYSYDSNHNSPETGHFIKRVDKDITGTDVGATIEANSNNIKKLLDEVFPVSFRQFQVQGGEEYEKGQSIRPSISWIIQREGSAVVPDRATVNGSTTGISANKQSWMSNSEIVSNTSYQVEVFYQGISCTRTADYKFFFKKYWGTSSKTRLTNAEIINLSSAWATGWTMSATTFNCSGGKYPYYIIPSEYYSESTFKCWIGGLRNTDLVVTDMNVENQYGQTKLYKIIRLGTIQTGVLSIKFASS